MAADILANINIDSTQDRDDFQQISVAPTDPDSPENGSAAEQVKLDPSSAQVFSSVQFDNNAVSNLSAVDARNNSDAGSTRRTATNLGSLDRDIRLRGSTSTGDQDDVFRFELSEDRVVDFRLIGLQRDADLRIYDASGRSIAVSSNQANNDERLRGRLGAGTYFVGIHSQSFLGTSYTLTFQTTQTPPEPVVAPETPSSPTTPDDPSENPPPTSPPQTPPATAPNNEAPNNEPPSNDTPNGGTTAPLADVPDVGGSLLFNIDVVSAPEAFAAGFRGQGVTVAIIDTGIDLDHPDLVSQLFVNPGEIAGNGIDDDGNGFIDDVSGYDFVDRDNVADDVNGHGTHVSGIVAASDDGRGVTGIAPDARIVPIRVLGDDGSGSSFDVAAGIRYAADLGINIINLSLGGGFSTVIDAAIQYATSLGSLVVAAAGNESAAAPGFPARFSANNDSVISVGASDSSGRIAGFSNSVGRSGAVQIDAPGVGIVSTAVGGGYRRLSGTSMAAPHVAAVAALALSANPNLSASQLRTILVTGANRTIAGSDSLGLLNAATTVAFAAAGQISGATVSSGAVVSGGTAADQASARNVGEIVSSDRPTVAPEEQSSIQERLFTANFASDANQSDSSALAENSPTTIASFDANVVDDLFAVEFDWGQDDRVETPISESDSNAHSGSITRNDLSDTVLGSAIV